MEGRYSIYYLFGLQCYIHQFLSFRCGFGPGTFNFLFTSGSSQDPVHTYQNRYSRFASIHPGCYKGKKSIFYFYAIFHCLLPQSSNRIGMTANCHSKSSDQNPTKNDHCDLCQTGSSAIVRFVAPKFTCVASAWTLPGHYELLTWN